VTTSPEDLRTAAISTTNTAAGLAMLVLDALPPVDRERCRALTLAGAAAALTVKWTASGTIELRLGFVSSDGPAQTVFAIDLEDAEDMPTTDAVH
jgi:hypothetical protein